jgi:pantoate--beta-alanine ligase
MQVINSIKEWRRIRKGIIDKTIGLVPTMGNLHQGHASLVQHSTTENDLTVLTVFINPTQFNNVDDLVNYPKTLESDLVLARDLGSDYVLLPSYEEMYPDNYNFKVTDNSDLSSILEGIARPGHFTGMLTIVLKLLLNTKPTRAYFGEKDYQQLKLVREMSRAFLLDTEIISCPTIRNKDGLPLSSRNNRLSEVELKKAALFSNLLTVNIDSIEVKRKLESEGFIVEYIEEYDGRRFGAVKIGNVRLIDNIRISI